MTESESPYIGTLSSLLLAWKLILITAINVLHIPHCYTKCVKSPTFFVCVCICVCVCVGGGGVHGELITQTPPGPTIAHTEGSGGIGA